MKKTTIAIVFAAIIFGCNSTKDSVETTSKGDTIEQRSRPQGERKAPPSIDEIFAMDTNADGLLSADEIKGPLARDFEKIDTNSDGFISRIELENAPKPQRGKRPKQ